MQSPGEGLALWVDRLLSFGSQLALTQGCASPGCLHSPSAAGVGVQCRLCCCTPACNIFLNERKRRVGSQCARSDRCSGLPASSSYRGCSPGRVLPPSYVGLASGPDLKECRTVPRRRAPGSSPCCQRALGAAFAPAAGASRHRGPWSPLVVACLCPL